MSFEWGKNDGSAPFETHAHRRVCANLSVPLTLGGLLVVTSPDEEIPSSPKVLAAILEELVEQGHVAELAVDSADDAVKTIAERDELPSIPDEKAANYVEAVANPRKGHFSVAEPVYVWTHAGRTAITGEEA